MDLLFSSSQCGSALWRDLKEVWDFFNALQGQLTLLGIAYFRKLLRMLLQSSLAEARETGHAIIAISVLLTAISVQDFHILPRPASFGACFTAGSRPAGVTKPPRLSSDRR